MTEEEKRLKASRENRRDLEAELKEERDRYDAQNQEAYDKEVSGENFLKDRAQEDEEEIDGGKLAQSIAFETSVGLATDLATVKLGFAPPVYALANFVSGAVANAIAQKIRGESKLSIGEILASGGVGIIPGTTIKTGKQLSKVVGKAGTAKRAAIATGLAGVGSEAVRIGIDEKRLLNTKEALLGGTLGGVTGASLQKIVNATPAVLNKFNNLIPEPLEVYAMSPRNNLNPPKVTAGGDIVEVSVDGKLKQYALFDRRNYTKYETLGDELVERSFGVIPDPSSPNYRQFQKFNQQVFRPLMERMGGENSFYSVLAENENFSYIEHLIAKGQHMDWFWELKGADRNASDNVRLLLNDPYKKLKDIVENYGYGTASNGYSGPFLESTDLTKRLIVDVEGLPVASGEGIPVVAQNSPGNIVIREAGTSTKPGRVVGKIGDYMDLLFRDEDKIIDGLQNMKIIPRKKYVKSRKVYENLSESEVRTKFKEWRKAIIEERLEEILRRKQSKLDISNREAIQRIDRRILEDMEDLRNEYPFLGGRIDDIIKDIAARDPMIGNIGGERGVLSRSELDKRQIANTKGGGNITTLDVTFKNGRKGKVRQVIRPDGTVEYRKGVRKGDKRIFKDIISASEFTPDTPDATYQEQLNLDG